MTNQNPTADKDDILKLTKSLELPLMESELENPNYWSIYLKNIKLTPLHDIKLTPLHDIIS